MREPRWLASSPTSTPSPAACTRSLPTLLELSPPRPRRLTVKAGIDDIERLRSAGLRRRAARAADRALRARRLEGPHPLRRADVRPAPVRRTRPRPSSRPRRRPSSASTPTRCSSTRAPGAPPQRPNAQDCRGRTRSSPPSRSPHATRHRSASDCDHATTSIGRLRDRLARRLTLGSLERIVATRAQRPPRRARRASVHHDRRLLPRRLARHRLHRRAVRVPAHRLAATRCASSDRGSGNHPPTRPHGSATSNSRSCSSPARRCSRTTARSLRSPARRFDGEPVNAVVTTADIDPATLSPPRQRSRRALRPALASYSTTPPASSATPAWASPRSRSPTACRSSPSRSAATSPRSPGASKSPAPESDSPRAS